MTAAAIIGLVAWCFWWICTDAYDEKQDRRRPADQPDDDTTERRYNVGYEAPAVRRYTADDLSWHPRFGGDAA